MTVAATLVIQFGDGADSSAIAVVELDDTRNVDSAGEVKTQFAPGDLVWFFVHHAPTLRIGTVVPTSGSVASMGRVMIPRTVEQQLWADSEPVRLSYIPAGGVDVSWFGRTSTLTLSGQEITASDPPAIGRLSYQIDAALYRLQTPVVSLGADETWPVAVVVTMEVV